MTGGLRGDAENQRTITITTVPTPSDANTSHEAVLVRDQLLIRLTQNDVCRDSKCNVLLVSGDFEEGWPGCEPLG